MNSVEFFNGVLRTNENFDIPTINRFMEYITNQIKPFRSLSEAFLEHEPELSELLDQVMYKSSLRKYPSEWVDTAEYKVKTVFDNEGAIVESIVTTGYKELFSVKGLDIIYIDDNSRTPFYHGIAICKDNLDKYGLINKYGEIIVEPKFDDIKTFIHNKYLIFEDNNKYGLINLNGNILIDAIYDYIINRDDTEYFTYEGEKYGYADDYLIVQQYDQFGLLDRNLELILDCNLKGIYAVRHEYYMHTNMVYFILENEENKFGLFVPSKNIKTNFDWDEVYWYGNRDVLPFRRGNHYGFYFIKTKSEKIMNFPFELDSYEDGKYKHIKHKELNRYALFDRYFNQLTGFEFEFPVSSTNNNEMYVFIKQDSALEIKTVLTNHEFFRKFGM